MTGIVWRRLDRPGHEACLLLMQGSRWHLDGAAVFGHQGAPCRLGYVVTCDSEWRTLAASVGGWIGENRIQGAVVVDRKGRWRLNGADCPDVGGRIDLDLNFSPSTNLLPVRRLDLTIGQEAEVRAAWLRFPGFTFEPLPPRYRRTGASTYRYESAGGRFVAELEVDKGGLVRRYPGFCEAEAL